MTKTELSKQLKLYVDEHRDKKILVCADKYTVLVPLVSAVHRHPHFVLTGKSSQRARELAIKQFRACPAGVLFCTTPHVSGWATERLDTVIAVGAFKDTDPEIIQARARQHMHTADLVIWEEPTNE